MKETRDSKLKTISLPTLFYRVQRTGFPQNCQAKNEGARYTYTGSNIIFENFPIKNEVVPYTPR